jgi:cytochrome c556
MSSTIGSFRTALLAPLAAAVAVVVVATGMVGDLAAQDGAALVKERQKQMGQMGKSFRPVMPIVKGENSKLSDALPSAETWHTNARKVIANFPAGTGRDAVPDTRAKPDVWSNRSKFESAAEKLVIESGKLLAAVKDNDIDAFRAQFKEFGKACGGCHEGKGKEGGEFRFAKQ